MIMIIIIIILNL